MDTLLTGDNGIAAVEGIRSAKELGMALNDQYLHAVVGSDQKRIWIVTAYYPDRNKWSNTDED